MKYIITGHKGLIGSALKKRLDEKWKCVGVYDVRNGIKEDLMDSFITEKADVIFHCAANCKINQCIKDPELAYENVIMIKDVLEACKQNKIPKIVYFSSSRVLSEEKNPYTASKLYGEELVKAYLKCYGINYLIIRPSTVYGGEDKTNRLMNIWINQALKDKPLYIYGDENKTLDFTYIDDFLDALFLVLDENNKEYNISGGKELRLDDVACEIIRQTGKGKLKYRPEEIAQPQTTSIDITPLRKKGYNPKVNIKEGIKREIKRCSM